jgi:cytidylate kinase
MERNKITISGSLGSGKTLLAKKLSEVTGYKIISVGEIQRKLAMQYGMDTTTFNKYMESHPEIDIECDNMVVEYGRSREPLILDSRLAWHFVPHSFKIHLLCNKRIAAQRVFNDTVRINEKFNNIEETYKSMVERRKSEVLRFKQQYNVDIDDLTNYDFVLDTSYLSPEVVYNLTHDALQQWQKGSDRKTILLSPKNLIPTESFPFSSEKLLNSEIEIVRIDDFFYIIKGHNLVSQSLLSKQPLIEVKMISAENQIIDNQSLTSVIENWEKFHNIKILN